MHPAEATEGDDKRRGGAGTRDPNGYGMHPMKYCFRPPQGWQKTIDDHWKTNVRSLPRTPRDGGEGARAEVGE